MNSDLSIQLNRMQHIVNTAGFSQVGKGDYLLRNHFVSGKDAILEFSAHFGAMQVDKTKGCCGNKLYMSAVLRTTEFIKCMESDQLPINQVMGTKSQEQIKSKRQVVKSLAQTVHFLANRKTNTEE